MRNNETGEYELVVGNRQLLTGFFIVVLLCAAAFAMGYVVGENTHSTKPLETAQPGNLPKPMDARPDSPPPETRSAAPAPSSPPSDSAPDTRAADTAASDTPQPTTRPARGVEPEPAPAPSKREAAAAPAPKREAEPAPGQYWQVTATTNRNSAETLVQTLKDKGFPATLTVGRDNLTHVLVGPYTDRASLGRAKTDLENNGFSQLVHK